MIFARLIPLLMAFGMHFALAQTASRFDGDWNATWEGKASTLEANFSLIQDTGTWQTLSRQRNDPCVGKAVPIRVDERTETSLKLTLRFSELITGCKDAKVSLEMAADGTVTGKRGDAALKLVRSK